MYIREELMKVILKLNIEIVNDIKIPSQFWTLTCQKNVCF